MRARDAGARAEAATLLAHSLGAEVPTPAMEANLDAFFDAGPARVMTFRLLEAEARTRGE